MITTRLPRSHRHALLLGCAMATLSVSTSSLACSTDPFLSSICVMAWTRGVPFNQTWVPANGAMLSVSSNTALFSLIGTAYGGNGVQTFQLPDLRGRVLIGAGQAPGQPNYTVGQAAGAASVTLSVANLPAHNHPIATAPQGNVAVTTGTGTLAAATSLTGVTATVAGSGLTLNGSNGGTLGTAPGNASLGTYTGLVKIYSDAAPTVAMMAGSIGGTAPVSFGGTGPTTALSGAPAVALSGNTGLTGGNTSINTLPPYLAMTYFIAVRGVYPSQD